MIVGEVLFHIPAFSALNSFGFTNMGLQASVLGGGIVAFILMTAISLRFSIKNFEKIDL